MAIYNELNLFKTHAQEVPPLILKQTLGVGDSSVVHHLASIQQALISIPSTAKK